MKIAVSSYSFQQYVSQGKMTQLDCVAKAKELGFDGIEFIDIAGGPDLEVQKANAMAIREEADRLGLPICSYAIGANLYNDDPAVMEAEVERLKGQVDVAKILGAAVMRHDVCYKLSKTGNGRSFDRMLPFISENARKVTEYAETVGIKTCTENHGYIAQDSDRVERLCNAVAHDNYGLLVDIGNFVCADENPVTAVSRVAPYAVHVHLKDMRVRPEKVDGCNAPTRGGNYFCGTILGEGEVPVKQCLRIIKNAGYDGFLVLEFEGAEDCIEGVTKGLAFARKVLSEL